MNRILLLTLTVFKSCNTPFSFVWRLSLMSLVQSFASSQSYCFSLRASLSTTWMRSFTTAGRNLENKGAITLLACNHYSLHCSSILLFKLWPNSVGAWPVIFLLGAILLLHSSIHFCHLAIVSLGNKMAPPSFLINAHLKIWYSARCGQKLYRLL